MRKTRILTVLTSAALSINLFSGSLGITCLANSADNAIDTIEDIEYSYVGTEHAYDPMAEIEAEEAEKKYRENADYELNKVIFSVIDHRSADQKGCYLSDNSTICCEYELKNVRMVYESVNKNYDNDDTTSAYEVFYEAETPSDDIWSIVDQLNEDEDIASAEPVYVWKKSAIGEPVEVSSEEFARETHFSILETDKVWKSLKNSSAPGAGTVIAVIDTGVDYNHKDLAENIWTNPGEIASNGIDDDNNGYVDDIHGIDLIDNDCDPMDDHGHGTHVAGAIAMTSGNGGGIGLAYGAKIMCIKAGSSSGTFASYDVAKAIKYAVDNGADVINMSFGGEEKSAIVEAALKDAAEYAVLVASAGNDGLPTSEASANGYKNCRDVYPAGFNTVIGVMAADNTDHLAPFSNWDYISGKGCEYEMAAPGVDIYSTLPDNRYAVWSGTSLAAANVAAAAAIIRSEYPNKSKYDARFIMGQLINASSSRAKAEPETITTQAVTTVTTTVADSVTTVPTTTVMSDDPLVNADVDGKDGIDKDDFAYMLKGLVGLNDLGGSKGDVNCDGTADMFDAVSILRLCDNKDSVKDIMASATIRKEYILFDIPKVDISEDGNYKSYTFKYNSSYPFKAITGQLKYNGKAYSGEFKEVKLLDSTSDDIIYEFNPENGKIAAYCADNENIGSFTISVYEGKEGSYSIDTNSLKFYDENGKEYLGYYLGMFKPELNYHSASSAAAVGTPSAVAVYDKKVEYPRLNIMDSLTVKAHPELRIEAVEMLETSDISEANNGDGIVQPGETVGLGISIWNSWAAASDVKVKIEAVGADGKTNPYVEVLDSNSSFDDMKAYSGADNGMTYSDGKSITVPIRIKVKDNAPNDGKMEFKITLTAKNGFDTTDKAVYTSDSNYSFIVQNIAYLRGKIRKDITLDRSRFWLIDGEVTIIDNAVMTIKPGTQIKFVNESSEYKISRLNVENGALICTGTEDAPILLKGNTHPELCFSAKSLIKMKYTELYNFRIESDPNSNSYCDHCKFFIAQERGCLPGKITNSIIYGYRDKAIVPDLTVSNAENCLFNGIIGIYGSIHQNNVYIGKIDDTLGEVVISERLNYNAILNYYNNSRKKGRKVDYETMGDSALYNYLGTDDPKLLRIPVEVIEEYPDIYNSYLTLESPEIEKIYPFMTEAYLTDKNGIRTDSAYIGREAFVHIKFNRDMSTDIQPDVTIGDLEPYVNYNGFWNKKTDIYDDYSVKGNWISSREWVGYYLPDDSINEGIMYIRSEGAVAADDCWLVTGNDDGRFEFKVIKLATVQNDEANSSKLKGKAGAGCNQLTWSQDEMATLAGYNIYRSVGDSSSFTKLNKSLLSNEDLQYTDTDVITGQKYYYYITTVDTDFNESKPSNTVECIPLDSEKPQIKHTPVTYSEPNKSIVISADVSDNVKVDNVVLFYKYSDENEWNDMKMRNTSGSNYQKVFSAYEVKNGQLQYYIEATDGINNAYYGTEKQPNIIEITSAVSTTTTNNPSTTITTTTVGIPTINNASAKVDIPNKEIKFFVDVSNNVNVDKITLYYRYIYDEKWTALEMQHTTNSTYFAKISPSDIKTGTLGYYIEASNGLNTNLYGSRLKPYVIEIPSLDSTNITTTTTTLNSTTETYTTSKPSTTSSTSTTINSNHATTTTTNKTQNTTTSTTTTKPTTTTTTTSVTTTVKSTTTATATTTTTMQTNPSKYNLGDVDNNSVIDAVDASKVLAYYARISTKQEGGFIDSQKKAADVNDDGIIDAVDASKILTYYAYASTTDEVFISIDVFLTNRSVKSEDPSG